VRLTAPVAAVGLKAYLSHARTLAWFDGLAAMVADGRADGVTVAAMPSATALASLAPRARAHGIVLGAQDCSAQGPGAWTGELPAPLLAEVGASFVEVGHVERRGLGDTDATVAAKASAAAAAGLALFVCVGESAPGDPAGAAAEVLDQLGRALAGVGRTTAVMVAYEPVWAIGAERPAPVEHIADVARRVREPLRTGYPGAVLLYGGTAGPGLYPRLADVLDGLALGRRAHDLGALGEVLDEMRSTATAPERCAG